MSTSHFLTVHFVAEFNNILSPFCWLSLYCLLCCEKSFLVLYSSICLGLVLLPVLLVLIQKKNQNKLKNKKQKTETVLHINILKRATKINTIEWTLTSILSAAVKKTNKNNSKKPGYPYRDCT